MRDDTKFFHFPSKKWWTQVSYGVNITQTAFSIFWGLMRRFEKWILIVGLALASQARAADGGAPEKYTGAVVDDNGRPVAGATVDCYCYQSGYGFDYRDREPALTQRTVTDSNGVFVVFSAPGATLAVVKKAGLATAWKTWSPPLADSSDPVVLTAPTALAGVVADENNQPVAGAVVWVTRAIIGNEYGRAEPANELFGRPAREYFSARTAADGRFRIADFPGDGRVGLAVSAAGKALRPFDSKFAGSQDYRSGAEDIKLVVGPAGAVQGNVVIAETGQPLGGVKLRLLPTDAGLYGADFREIIESSADGTFRIPDVQPGRYSVFASIRRQPVPDCVVVQENNQVTVVAGETAHGVVVHATKGALAQVSVIMTNEGTLLEGVPVSSSGSTVYTGINGMALLRVPVGKTYFSARQDWRSQSREADIEAGRVNNVWIELIPPPSISGTVRDAAGAPAAGTLVSFHPGVYPDAPDYTEVTTDKDGRYEVTLRLGREDFFWSGPITPTNFILARSLERNLAAIQEFEKIPTNLDLTLQPGITFSGFVKNTEGAPVTNAVVSLGLESAHSSRQVGPPLIKVNAQGFFTLPAMPQGRAYWSFGAMITAKGYGAINRYVKAEETKTNHFEFPAFVLKRANRKLAGQVLGLDGKPVVGANVSFSGQGQLQRPSTKSGSDGHFGFDGVCEGDVTVSASYQGDASYSSVNTPPNTRVNTQGNAPAQGGDTNVVVRLGVNLVSYGQNSSPPRKMTGTVRDPSGTAVGGVTMSLYPVQGRTLDSQTDAEGRYEFRWQGLAAGNITTWLLARDVKGGLAAIHQVDEKMTNLDLTLQEGLTISTQVRDSGGLPLTNATARVTVWAEPNRGFGLNPQPMMRDDHGHFRLNALPQGLRYGFSVGAPGYSSAGREAVAEETKTNFVSLPPVVLERTDREVAGLVLDLNGNPATAVRLVLQDVGMAGLQPTQTDSSGHFVFSAVSRGQVTILVSDPNYDGRVQAEGGDTNVVLRLEERQKITPGAKGTVSGTVFDPSGAPAAGVILTALPQRGATIRSDAGGKYTLQWESTPTTGDMPTKAALLGRDPERNLAAIMDVDAKSANLDLHLQPGLTLSGAVRDADGQPVTNASVSRFVLYQGTHGFFVSQLPTNVNAQGLFSISALPQGVRYELFLSADGYGNTHAQAPADTTQTNQIQLPATVLKAANRQLAGQVIGSDDKPCWGAQVTVQGEGQPSRTVGRTDSNGHFAINQVCEGPVDVYAFLRPDSGSVQAGRGVVRASGGDTNIVVKLGMTNGVPIAGPGGVGQALTNRPPPSAALQP